ncbi:MAG: outer membrane protein transport protein, partial [Verrucomicrobia bacterium]|nr:outer membrane protein transport protein [Verrucomicrobiota bacterium]
VIRFPSVIAAGYGIKVLDNLQLGVDIEWIEFSRYDKLVLDVGPLNALLPETVIPQNWEDSWTIGLGADWQVTEALTLRGGDQYVESPIPSSTLAPTLPDADRHVVSLGVGYAWKGHRVDLAYALSLFEDRQARNPNPLLNGTYELSSHLFGLSYGYVF